MIHSAPDVVCVGSVWGFIFLEFVHVYELYLALWKVQAIYHLRDREIRHAENPSSLDIDFGLLVSFLP